MQVKQLIVPAGDLPTPSQLAMLDSIDPQWLLLFAGAARWHQPDWLPPIRAALPATRIMGCSTAGEIAQQRVETDSLTLTAIHFDHADFHLAAINMTDMQDSYQAGKRLGDRLRHPGLSAVFILGQGVAINGSALINGLAEALGPSVQITGGLAGDNGAFHETWTVLDDTISNRQIVGIGFYGDALRLHHGSFGGWQPFGPIRKVTRSAGNVLYELDGKSALAIYKEYLGDYARDLPASGLLFPFAMLDEAHSDVGLIRTILGIDDETGSLILAGDVHDGTHLRLMHASTDALVDGAQAAAEAAWQQAAHDVASLSILISCVGRKLVMGDRVEEELEAVADVLHSQSILTGFYSNGEISPHRHLTDCKLHNQTMTITCIQEI
ncbi:FIST N-terminal domain-containing protein [Chitinivorax sp. B]|uniref:FIST signal transduction protein n=1 Tax=Chitinivorax sp. B TaxID=2502235 RepID=UPI0010F8CF98|nr:FIST N-terminal domain-containing protein [Chitinivorax sp. B]